MRGPPPTIERSCSRAGVTAGVTAGVALVAAVGAWLVAHRRSPTVRAWMPSVYPTKQSGPVATKAFGIGSHTVLLLHGLGATADFWGAAYDRLGDRHRVLVPDLLGFGGSLDEDGANFGLGRQLVALDRLVVDHAPESERVTVVAHSMGSALALAWAASYHEQVEQVICFGAPMFASEDDARDVIGQAGPMARTFLLDPTWAERACALSCAHRDLAGWLAVAIDPSVPVAMARRSPLHTWPAYRDAMHDLILDAPWRQLLAGLADHGVPTTMVWGDQDQISDPTFARSLLDQADLLQLVIVPGADHHLPITHAQLVVDLLADRTPVVER